MKEDRAAALAQLRELLDDDDYDRVKALAEADELLEAVRGLIAEASPDFVAGFHLGFEASREGFNGECEYDHCALSGKDYVAQVSFGEDAGQERLRLLLLAWEQFKGVRRKAGGQLGSNSARRGGAGGHRGEHHKRK